MHFIVELLFFDRKLADRLGSKATIHQQQRAQYENQLMNIYSSRHEQLLEKIYLNILEKQYTNDQRLGLKQQIILDSLNQQRNFTQLIENLLSQRLNLVEQTNGQMKKITNYIQMIVENGKLVEISKDLKQETGNENEKEQKFNFNLNITNLIDKTKQIENEFSNR